MLSKFAKFLLIGTAMAPILGGIAINSYHENHSWNPSVIWAGVALLLVLICHGVIKQASTRGQTRDLKIESIERADKEALVFLVTYSIPFLAKDNMGFSGDWGTGIYILMILFGVIAHAGAYHFNPILGLLGYHFYSITNHGDSNQLVITKSKLKSSHQTLTVVEIADGVFIQTTK